ncbi:NAD(P)/FAD-dependent oxidoreductase [Marine Group I thaumarchaeote]|uniref:NADH:ubiquinone reductase (non-electrogenic) n=1 Tax=Marine Group I thaumarchaeote TaxID=2511932 RepID=A0A7K4M8S3_9ARCH|nr:MAG: NAD(P)/FAD-dependent oxidoreductase [Nitrosopumilus sp. YT1]NMI81976.1 NAD(P)/FAD-dependent oxidoreductase [Candidatus Nitrosopumilus sp. MTA1]NWJ20190.1 NAD(P)/FAD-dependent oxidoreductase [Marine Group I thaumarchaeote]
MPQIKKILILGGGFGGINVLKTIQNKFKNEPNIRISIVSKDNYFLYTPMLPQVSSGLIHPSDITIPIRKLCKQAEFYQASISSMDLEQKLVTITRTFDGKVRALDYDYLIIALGSNTNFFDNKNIEEHSFVIKTVEDAIAIHDQIIHMLESAAQTSDVDFKKKLMTFTVVGAGFAGVETMGEINYLVRESVKNFYPSIGEENISMNLVASEEFILPELGPKLGKDAGKYLRKAGVNVITNTKAVDAGEDFAQLDNGEKIPCMTLIWAAGVVIDPIISSLKCKHGKSGKLKVGKYLRLTEYENIFALGDCALITNPSTGEAYPPTAQNSIHQSATVANNLYSMITGKTKLKEFSFESKGMMTTLGRRVAIAIVYGLHCKGSLAWLIWRTYYLYKLPMLEKRFQVATSWIADLLFKRDLTFVGKIKKKSLTKINIKSDTPSIKDLFKDL